MLGGLHINFPQFLQRLAPVFPINSALRSAGPDESILGSEVSRKMFRRVRVGIGYCFCLLFVFLESAESFRIVRELVPERLLGFVNQIYALPSLIVGVLLIWLARADGNKDADPPNVRHLESIRNANTNTASPTQKVEQHFHLAPPLLQESKKSPDPLKPKHNVQFISPRQLPATSNAPLLITACFRNIPIPHESVPNFSYVRSKITYFDDQDEEILEEFPGVWSEDSEPSIEMEPGPSHNVVLAAFGEGRWSACRVVSQDTSWGATAYDIENDPLPFGRSWAVVTLIGEHNISIEPVRIFLDLKQDGTAFFKQQSKGPRALDSNAGSTHGSRVGPRLLGKITFEYLPRESPLDHGWSLLKEERTGVRPMFSALPAGAPASKGLSIKPLGWYGIDYSIVEAVSTMCNTLVFRANFATDGKIYTLLQMPSTVVGQKAEEKWIQFGVNRGPNRIEAGVGIVTLHGAETDRGWELFNVSLDEAVDSTFGQQGLIYGEYGKLLKIRIRGSLSISELEMFRL